MAEDLYLIICRKIVQLGKYKNELIDKLELIIEKHDEMVPHINQAHVMATQGGRIKDTHGVATLVKNLARKS